MPASVEPSRAHHRRTLHHLHPQIHASRQSSSALDSSSPLAPTPSLAGFHTHGFVCVSISNPLVVFELLVTLSCRFWGSNLFPSISLLRLAHGIVLLFAREGSSWISRILRAYFGIRKIGVSLSFVARVDNAKEIAVLV